jgi:glucose repression regulatory protein TUP1
MYAAQAGRGVAAPGGRGVGDVLEQIKLEFSQLAEDSNGCQRQRDEYQHKWEAQKQEISQMQQMIREFSARSRAIEAKYEEEVQWLRRQIEEKGVTLKPREKTPAAQTSSFGSGGALGTTTLPSFAALSAGHTGGSSLDALSSASTLGGLSGALSFGGLAAAAARDTVDGGGCGGSSSKAVDSKGRPMDDWNVVHNPNSSTKMYIELSYTLEHDSVVCCVRFSNDGRYIATGCNKVLRQYLYFCTSKASKLTQSVHSS